MQKSISKEMVLTFAELTGDMNLIHIDQEYAKNTIFQNCIVHGTFISGFIGKKIADSFDNPILKSLSLTFLRPIYVGSEIKIVFDNIEYVKNKIYLDIVVFAKFNDEEYLDAIIGKSEIVIKKV